MEPRPTPMPTPALDQAKTEYTEQWEKEEMEKLYKKFVALIGPLDQPINRILIQRVNEHFKDVKEMTMLEIGAGAGRGTNLILDGIANDRRILYTGIDVSAAQKKGFEENKDLPRAGLVVKNYELSSWQDYAVPHTFDFILAQHSWYGIGKGGEHIEKVMNSLKEGGMASVILSGADTVSLHAWRRQGADAFAAEDFEKTLQDAGIEYEKIGDVSAPFTREDFVKDGRLTQKGMDLCGYLYKRELKEDDEEVIKMLEEAPEESFKYPKFLFLIKK